jgi:cytochrome c5
MLARPAQLGPRVAGLRHLDQNVWHSNSPDEVEVKTVQFVALFPVLLIGFAVAKDRPRKAIDLLDNPIYEKNCAKCHGKTAQGKHLGGGPSLLSDSVAAMSPDGIRHIITEGQKRMPKFGDKLTADDINGLVDQIKAANAK